MKIRSAIALVSVVGVALLAGCGPEDDQDDEGIASASAGLSASLSLDGLSRVDATDPPAAALAVAQDSQGDKGCRTRRVDAANPNIVHVTLDRCTKRFGRHVISGEMTLVFSRGEAGALHVERTSEGLTVDERPASHTASTDITFEQDGRVAHSRGTWVMTRKDGSQITHVGEHTVTFRASSGCRVSTGTSVDQVDGEEVGTGTSELAWCELPDGSDGCPTGLIEHDRPGKQKHVLKRFDGTETVNVEITKPRRSHSRQIQLACTPQ